MNAFHCLLLIDDDHIATFLNTSLLKKLHMCENISTAYNGKEGIEKLISTYTPESECPALIFLDINMPVMNGFEFMDAFHELNLKGKEKIIIVVLTSSENEGDRNKMSSFGIKYYLSKPLTEIKINNLIKEMA